MNMQLNNEINLQGMTYEEKRILREQRCRTCLSRQGQHNIFETANCIRTELLYLTNLEIRKYDKLPVSICDHCLNELRNACAFKKQCQVSYYALIEEYENSSSKDISSLTRNYTTLHEQKLNDAVEPIASQQIGSDDDVDQNPIEEPVDLSSLLEPQIIVQEQTEILLPSKPLDNVREILKPVISVPVIEEKNNDIVQNEEEEIVITPDIYNEKRENETKRVRKRRISKEYHECKECGKGFSRLQNLKSHMHVHTGIKSHTCVECGKAFSRSEHLKRHSKIHAEEKPYPCPICEKRFNTKGYLSTHIAAHSKDKRHKCAQCDKSFGRIEHLKRHVLSHKVQYEHQCTMCEKSFALESHLMIHLQLHSGEKSHKCDVCGLIFRSTPSLESHKLNHTISLPGYLAYPT